MQSPSLLERQRAAGALFAAAVEPPLALEYGDVPAEYEAAQTGTALFDQSGRGLVRVRGAERAVFLHRLLANRVRDLAPGQGNANLLLTSKGKIAHSFDLSVWPEWIDLSTPPGQSAALAAALDTYLFSEQVAIEELGSSCAPLALAGPKARALVAATFGADPPEALHEHTAATFEGAPLSIAALPVAGSFGFRLDAGPALAGALWDALARAGARPVGRIAYDSLRVEAGAAEPGVDVDDSIYPQEARLEPAFSLDKGCYIGQEVVAKIDTYGGLNKRLHALRVSHDDPVPHGTRLFQDDGAGERRDLGVVTSWAYSFVLDTGLVLAYVKRKHQEPGTLFELDAGPASATIVELPVRSGAL